MDVDPAAFVRGLMVPADETRVFWRGVTLLEEHEIAPTYELYLAGCPLRCPFCAVPGASRSRAAGERMAPEALVEDLLAEHHPPFRALALVGGEPSLHLPWIRRLLPLLRRELPDTVLVLNTALCWEPSLARELAASFDWVVGTVRYYGDACGTRLGAHSGHPAQARWAVEALLEAGGRLLLRLLVLPGHHDCCAAPLARWIAGLEGDLRARVMLNYAPVGEARSLPGLDRGLDDHEARRAAELLPSGVPRPLALPLQPVPLRLDHHRDPPVSLEIDAGGQVVAPMVTGTILPWLAERQPALRERRVYLGVSHAL